MSNGRNASVIGCVSAADPSQELGPIGATTVLWDPRTIATRAALRAHSARLLCCATAIVVAATLLLLPKPGCALDHF